HAADMLMQAENRRAVAGGVTADTLEYGTSIADHVRENVDLGVVPGNEASVVPDFLSGRQHPIIIATQFCVTRRRVGKYFNRRLPLRLQTVPHGQVSRS